jgi:hypothetical protein
MPLAEIMRGIEEHSFSSELNLASGTRAFRRNLREHILVRQLEELARNVETRDVLAHRVEELAAQEIDTRYESPFDAALSAYLTVLADTGQPETTARAATAAARARNTWWTVGISHELLARAVATGWAQVPVAEWRGVPVARVQEVDWQRGLRSTLQNWLADRVPVTPITVTARQILNALRAAEAKAQVPKAGNVVEMPLPSEEGDRPVWKPRRRGTRAKLTHAH